MRREEDTIVIRDSVTKESLPTRNFKGITLLREELDRYNKLIDRHSVSIDGSLVSLSYKRVYHDNLKGSGRYYSNSSFQTIGKEHRAGIVIDGEETTELDYGAIHPRLLYTLEGISIGKHISPYHVYGVEKEHCKLCLLMMLNADNKRSALQAAFNELRGLGISWDYVVHIFKELEKGNERISKYFYQSGLWRGLQYLDSSIATQVLQLCIKRNILALPYHDSFRIRQGDKEILQGVMFEAWKAIMNNTDNCVVTEKNS